MVSRNCASCRANSIFRSTILAFAAASSRRCCIAVRRCRPSGWWADRSSSARAPSCPLSSTISEIGLHLEQRLDHALGAEERQQIERELFKDRHCSELLGWPRERDTWRTYHVQIGLPASGDDFASTGRAPIFRSGPKRSPKTMPLDAAACVQTANLHSRNFRTMSAPRRHKTHKWMHRCFRVEGSVWLQTARCTPCRRRRREQSTELRFQAWGKSSAKIRGTSRIALPCSWFDKRWC